MSLLAAHEASPSLIKSRESSPVEALNGLPRLTTTVPREYVHRASLAEVFLTDCEKIGEDRYVLTGQWPRAHTFFNSGDGRHDPLQAGETIRQAGLYLAHAELGIPLGHHFVLWNLNWSTVAEQLVIGATPSELSLEVVCSAEVRRNGQVSRRRIDVQIRRDGLPTAAGSSEYTCLSPAAYRRLRAPALATVPTVPTAAGRPGCLRPGDVGRTFSHDVVLAPAEQPGRWLLAPDPLHPVMFDHAGDHLPGMVLLEAARQAASARLAPHATLVPAEMSASFHRYVEFGVPCWIEATSLPSDTPGTECFEVTGEQDGHRVFTARVCGPAVPR